jgi:acyl carrier protein
VTDTRARLIRCFATVFSNVNEQTLPQATQDTLEGWDSVAAITLINVIEEEFRTSIDFELVPELNSFERIEKHLEQLG